MEIEIEINAEAKRSVPCGGRVRTVRQIFAIFIVLRICKYFRRRIRIFDGFDYGFGAYLNVTVGLEYLSTGETR